MVRATRREEWRRRADSNRRIADLQSAPLTTWVRRRLLVTTAAYDTSRRVIHTRDVARVQVTSKLRRGFIGATPDHPRSSWMSRSHSSSSCSMSSPPSKRRGVAAQYRDRSLAFGSHSLADEHPVERVDVADAADRRRTVPSGPTLGSKRAYPARRQERHDTSTPCLLSSQSGNRLVENERCLAVLPCPSRDKTREFGCTLAVRNYCYAASLYP